MPTIRAHRSASYPPRTFENASRADLTAAFALDFSTAGERLTKKAADGRYVALPLASPAIEQARSLFVALRATGVSLPTLNIAGNGIYSLADAGWDQAAVNAHLLAVLAPVHRHWPIGQVVSGGQTGIDWAGCVAATALGIASDMLLPAGFLQRGLDHQDTPQDPKDLLARLVAESRALKPLLATLEA